MHDCGASVTRRDGPEYRAVGSHETYDLLFDEINPVRIEHEIDQAAVARESRKAMPARGDDEAEESARIGCPDDSIVEFDSCAVVDKIRFRAEKINDCLTRNRFEALGRQFFGGGFPLQACAGS